MVTYNLTHCRTWFNWYFAVFLYRIIFLLYFHGMKPPSKPPPASKPCWGPEDLADWSGRQHVAAYLHRNYELGMHGHGFIEINLVVKGRGWHYFGSRAVEAVPGDLFIIPLGMRHGYLPVERLDIFHLLLHPRFIEEHGARMRALEGFVPLFTEEPLQGEDSGARHHLRLSGMELREMAGLFKRIVSEKHLSKAPADIGVQALSLYFIQLACRLGRAGSAGKKSALRLQPLKPIMDFIQEHYADKVDLEALARAGGFQANYLCRLFRRHYGLSPLEYLNRFRVLMAERLILETDKRMKQIARMTGFYDAAHMNRAFMRLRGHAPGSLRK